MAVCLRGKTQILLGPKFKLELFYSLSLHLSLPLPFTHTYTLHSQKPNYEEEKNSTDERTGPFSNEDKFWKVNQFFCETWITMPNLGF